MVLPTPHSVQGRRWEFLAGFEIPAPELARDAIPARLARAGNPMRW